MTQVWCIRGGEQNRLVDNFVDERVIAVGYYKIPDGRTISESAVARSLRADGYAAAGAAASRFTSFVFEIAIDDIVVMPDTSRGEAVIGLVDGPYQFRDELDPQRYRHR